jgi:hypothetical protein
MVERAQQLRVQDPRRRAQQQAVDNAEQRSVHPDSDRQRCDDREREAR